MRLVFKTAFVGNVGNTKGTVFEQFGSERESFFHHPFGRTFLKSRLNVGTLLQLSFAYSATERLNAKLFCMISSMDGFLSLLRLFRNERKWAFFLFERRDNINSLNFNSRRFSGGGGVCVK